MYGLREALAQICREGLESVIKRHQNASDRLQIGLEKLGLKMFLKNKQHRLPTVNAILVPENVEWTKIVTYAIQKYKKFSMLLKCFLKIIFFLDIH